MRRFLLSLMVFVMLTPGLACAQFMPHQEAAQETPMPDMHMAKDMPCCPKPDTSPCDGIKFFKDCMKADLQQAQGTPLLKKADAVKYTPAILSEPFVKAFAFPVNQAARPPPDRHIAFNEHQPVYLATLRLRI